MHAILFFAAAAAALTIPAQLGSPISTSTGTVTGTVGAIAKDVSVYYAIPYALPPIKERRWLAPQKFEDRTKAINGTKWGKDCPGVLPFGGTVMDEDCLYLNVWSPPKKPGELKAVLLWIYGGAFMSGTANMWPTDGSRLASDQDVVLVAINYRMSILGFPGAPGLPDQNLGILDQRAAVEWVRDNIKEFGGDPERITLVSHPCSGL
jgi:cholinesterase